MHPSIARRISIAVGPVSPQPSWAWVGHHILRELSVDHRVAPFVSVHAPPDCDVLFILKARPSDECLARAARSGTRIVYVPIDAYRSRKEIRDDAAFLAGCDAVLCHSERLLPELAPYCRRLRYVEHHARDRLDPPSDYRERGYVLWVGGFQYVPYLLQWLRAHPLPAELKLLTDVDQPRAVAAASQLAGSLQLDCELREGMRRIDGHEILPWSGSLQAVMMAECKAALDIKDEIDFNQVHKPPTKAQQFVASGIPFAANRGSSAFEYFERRGFRLALPTDADEWFSPEYWRKTREQAADLTRRLSSANVGDCYRNLLDELAADGGAA